MFAQLTILVLAGLAGPLLAYGRRGLIPVVIGELVAGFVLGHTGFGVIDSAIAPLPVLSAIGFAMLMFSAGTHVDVGSPAIRQGFARGLLALAVVAVIAAPIGLLLDHALGVGHPALIAVIVAGSSAAIAFPILEERHLAGPNVAFLIAWVALADSVTVVIMPLTIAKSGSPLEAIGGDAAIIAAGVMALLVASRVRRQGFVRQMRNESLQRGWAWQVRISLVLLIGLSAIAQETGASTLVAGFLAGMVLVRLHESDRLAVQFSGVANGFFVPLFFVLLGAELNLRALLTSPSRILLAIGLALAAVVAHVIAARVAGHERYLATGLAASAQLGMPAAAASLGLSTGLLGPAEAAALVAGGCLTLIPATIGSLLLARGMAGAPSSAQAGSARERST
ncbi:MAG TPA: cation:proton antiporter [Candidatus Saccharimonadales bacterium]|nr:cation:proton antiporter [Candidatus Saccharimonadales bacterium]